MPSRRPADRVRPRRWATGWPQGQREFVTFWAGLRAALRPGAIVACELFGPKHTWAGDPTMNIADRAAIAALTEGLGILDLDESDSDGESFSGPKHWHVFDLVARRPG